MLNLMNEMALRRRSADLDEGATAVEYALLVGLVAVIVVSAVTLLGGDIDAMLDGLAGRLGGGTATT